MNQLSKVEKEIIAYGHRLRTLLNYHTRVLLSLGDVDAVALVMMIMTIVAVG